MSSRSQDILVVGAGFSGAVYARTLADAGYTVTVIDKRPHVAGNAYDHVDENGIRVHVYGPHLFHTKNQRVIEWISRFATFVPYTHKVRAQLPSGLLVPMPINLDTVNSVFGTNFCTADQVKAHLASISLPIASPANAAEHLYSKIGQELTDLFFRPYTKKMWALDLEEMSPAVVKRIPLRFDRVDTYFDESDTQMMPHAGYTALFDEILSHPRISVALNTSFDTGMRNGVSHVFNSMPIDEWFDSAFGELPYRSIRFHNRTVQEGFQQGWSVTNFTDADRFTRETAWHLLPHHVVNDTGRRSLTKEEPCDYRDNYMERYYPVKTADGRYQSVYEQYRKQAVKDKNMTFIGRCGTYQYLDMDQVINQSLVGATAWLDAV